MIRVSPISMLLLFSGGVGRRPCAQRTVARAGELDQQASFRGFERRVDAAYSTSTPSRGDRWKRVACSVELRLLGMKSMLSGANVQCATCLWPGIDAWLMISLEIARFGSDPPCCLTTSW